MNDKTEMPQEAARPKRKFGPSTVARLQVARVSEMGAFLDAQTGNTRMISCCTRRSRRIPSPSAISSMYSSIWTQSAA